MERIVGPRKTCPACSSDNVTDPKYCSDGSRVMVSFLLWCTKEGKHLHQRCKTCSFKWTGTPVEVR